MPISVCQRENGATHLQIVTDKECSNYKEQLESFLNPTYNNPFHLLDEENIKPLHKLVLSNGNVVYSTHNSVIDLFHDLSTNSNTHTNLLQNNQMSNNELDNFNTYLSVTPAINKTKLANSKKLAKL